MKTPVIDGLRAATQGFVDPEIGKFEEQSAWSFDKLDQLLKPLNLDTETVNKLLDEVTEISFASEQSGFRSGFRLATRLMVESLGTTGSPEKGGGA